MTKQISKGWQQVRISEISDTYAGGTPSRRNKKYYQGELLWVKSGELNNGLIFDTEEKITNEALNDSSVKIVPRNTVLIAMYGATAGKVGVLKKEGTTNQAVLAVPDSNNKFHYEYIYYLLSKETHKLLAATQGTGQPNLSKTLVDNLKVLLPPKKKQQKIAKILFSTDEAIQKVNEAIRKTERVKQGLMNKLLTEGIGHKELKKTKIGEIPKEWELVKLSEVAEIRGKKTINKIKKIAFIPMEKISETSVYIEYVVKERKDIKSYTYCEKNDLLLAKITPSLENGKQGLLSNDIPNGFAFATTEVFPINCKNIHNKFLFYILKTVKFRNKIIGSMIGTTGRQLASKIAVENLKIPFPKENEQKKIAKILLTMDKKLNLQKQRKEKLVRIKQGLMNDLLTGRKRVEV